MIMAAGKMQSKRSLRSGAAARKAGVNNETLRYYERNDLLPAPPRSESGYRQYPANTVTRIRFIKQAQELGFSLKEIKELLALRVEKGRKRCEKVRGRAAAKRDEIDKKLRNLRSIRKALDKLITSCEAGETSTQCPIIDALETDPHEDKSDGGMEN